ncbi:hypothetical protein LCGC14_1567160 [marine sediment metagenome]|uniref:Uncharacterized protein n=1 Tax=marine sediment metagenome TaxID=412755 RepID=A0A0F9IKN8_9ZZZZ
MTGKGVYIKAKCYRMKVGNCLRVSGKMFLKAFPFGFPTIYKTPEQAFLSTMMGSAWGVWRVDRDFDSMDFIISRHEESKKRYYADPDREHLFKRVEDGTLERR